MNTLPLPVDLNRATEVTPEVDAAVEDCFEYKPWDQKQVQHGASVRAALALAYKALLQHVPPCADRSVALRKIREARMDANSAITHRGKY